MFSGGSTHLSPRLWPHITILALWAEAGLFYVIGRDIYTLCYFTQHLPFLSSLPFYHFSLHIFDLSFFQTFYLPSLSFIFVVMFPLQGKKHNNWSVILTFFPSSHLLPLITVCWCLLFFPMPSNLPFSPWLYLLFPCIPTWLITTLPHLLFTKPKQVYLFHCPNSNLTAKMTEIYSER